MSQTHARMFGLGGIFVEVLKDVTFRVTPVSKGQARRMMSEIRGAPILKGARGEAPRDQEALIETICKFSNMILDLRDEISETDANPLLLRVNMEAGHGGKSGRFQRYRELAEEYAFLLDQAGISE